MARKTEYQTDTTNPEADNALTDTKNAVNATVDDSKRLEPSEGESPQNDEKTAEKATQGRTGGTEGKESVDNSPDSNTQQAENATVDDSKGLESSEGETPQDEEKTSQEGTEGRTEGAEGEGQASETADNDTEDSEASEERSKVQRANREAAKYRRQASELKTQVATLQTQLVELLAGELMRAPEDLGKYIAHEDMLNEVGELDLDKAQQAVNDLLAAKPHLKLNQVNGFEGRRIRRGPPKGSLSERMGATGETTWSGFLNREKNVEDNEFTGSDRGKTRNEEREYRIGKRL